MPTTTITTYNYGCIAHWYLLLEYQTASRNVAFKVARLRDAIMQDQDEFIIRDSNLGDAALVASDRANLEDIACNADLYISNHEDLIQTGAFGLDNG